MLCIAKKLECKYFFLGIMDIILSLFTNQFQISINGLQDPEAKKVFCSQKVPNKNPNCARIGTNRFRPSMSGTFTKTRLGNQLSAFASLYSLWRRYGIYNYITPKQYTSLSEVFTLPRPKSKCINDWPYFIWSSKGIFR